MQTKLFWNFQNRPLFQLFHFFQQPCNVISQFVEFADGNLTQQTYLNNNIKHMSFHWIKPINRGTIKLYQLKPSLKAKHRNINKLFDK